MTALTLRRLTIKSLFSSKPLWLAALCTVMLALAVVFSLPSQANRATATQSPLPAPSEPPFKPQQIYLPHWSNEQGFGTTIFIRNVNIKYAVNAKVSLLLAKRTITLAPISIRALQTVPLDVSQALGANGDRDDQSGGAVIDFDAQSAGSINAYAQVLDTSNSLSLSLPFMERITSAPRTLDAVAFFYSKQTDGYVAIQNTTDAAVTIAPSIYYAAQAISLGKQQLQPREIVTIKLPNLPQQTGNGDPFSIGLRIEHNGAPGAVVVQGWALEKNRGFSLPFAFHTPSNCNCSGDTQHLYGAGVAIGVGAMMIPGATFSPYLAVRNRSNGVASVAPIFSYDSPNGVQKVSLPTFNLSAQTNTLVNLKTYQDQRLIPSNVLDGNIDLQYKGEPGALVAELASVDQYGSFVSPVPLVCSGNRNLHMSYWRTDGDWHSMLTLQNIANAENDVEITISYPGGVYVLDKKIAAGATTMVSINELQQAQTPDAAGRRIPLTATTGGVNIWSRNVNSGLVINAMLMNPTTKTCGSCNGTGYVQSNVMSDQPGFASMSEHESGDIFSVSTELYWTTSTWSTDYFSPLESSTDTSVAEISGSSVTCNLAGESSLRGRTSENYPTDPACSNYHSLTTTGTIAVRPKITSLSPSRAVVGQTTSITISGAGFRSGATVNAGNNITTSNVTVNSAAQITVSFNIAVNAAGGNRSITVKAGNKTSNGANFYVQIPTSLTVAVTPGASAVGNPLPNGCPSNNPYGMELSIFYQIMDQDSPAQAINATLPVRENLINLIVNGISNSDFTKINVPVTASGNSTSSGQILDDPVGVSSNGPFTQATFTQQIFIPLSDTVKPIVRTNNFTLTGKSGCGQMSNGTNGDISVNVNCQ